MTKFFVLASSVFALGFSGVAWGEEASRFEEHKAQALKNIEQEISMWQEKKSCVSGAASGEAIKACHERFRASQSKQNAEKKEVRAQKIDAQIQKLQERKQNLQAPAKK
jgi:hypothetical protein